LNGMIVIKILLLFTQTVPTLPDSFNIAYRGKPLASVHRSDYARPVFPLYDEDKIRQLLEDLDRKVSLAPHNARIGGQGEIIPEQAGQRLDRKRLAEQILEYYYGTGPVSIDAPLTLVYPKVDSELLAHIRVKQIGQYVTYYNPGNKNRSHNISLAAKAIDNTVIFPGESFSFNQVVGMRTKQKGYLQAPVIVRGELSEGIGGGICQVSSTLFNAADRAGLSIIQRYSHSRDVPYVPPGRDATVSWGGPDFRFRNQYNQPVLIRAHSGGGQMRVAIYSSEVIDFRPRQVPGMSDRLPEEISVESQTYRNH